VAARRYQAQSVGVAGGRLRETAGSAPNCRRAAPAARWRISPQHVARDRQRRDDRGPPASENSAPGSRHRWISTPTPRSSFNVNQFNQLTNSPTHQLTNARSHRLSVVQHEEETEFIRITRPGRGDRETSAVTDGIALVSAMTYLRRLRERLGRRAHSRLPDLAGEARAIGLDYRHHQTGEDNADAHLKRTIMGHSGRRADHQRRPRSRPVGAGLLRRSSTASARSAWWWKVMGI